VGKAASNSSAIINKPSKPCQATPPLRVGMGLCARATQRGV